MVDQVGVERIVPRHQHAERVGSGATGPPGLLPHRRDRAGVPGQQHHVQTGHVDAELQRVGRRQSQQRTVEQPPLQFAALLPQVTGPVGGHPVDQLRHRPGQRPAGRRGDRLGPAAGPHEGQGPHSLDDRVGQQVGRLHQRRAADRLGVTVLGRAGYGRTRQERRLPQGERDTAPGRPVPRDCPYGQPGQFLRRRLRVAGGGGREHEHGRPLVPGQHPLEPAQEQRDVRAEHPAIDVAFVDDDEGQPAQEAAPLAVSGQDRPVQHVRVGEDQPRVGADPVPLRGRRVTVVPGRPEIGQVEPGDRPQLIGGERLRRGQVERGRPRVLGQLGQHRQQIGQ